MIDEVCWFISLTCESPFLFWPRNFILSPLKSLPAIGTESHRAAKLSSTAPKYTHVAHTFNGSEVQNFAIVIYVSEIHYFNSTVVQFYSSYAPKSSTQFLSWRHSGSTYSQAFKCTVRQFMLTVSLTGIEKIRSTKFTTLQFFVSRITNITSHANWQDHPDCDQTCFTLFLKHSAPQVVEVTTAETVVVVVVVVVVAFCVTKVKILEKVHRNYKIRLPTPYCWLNPQHLGHPKFRTMYTWFTVFYLTTVYQFSPLLLRAFPRSSERDTLTRQTAGRK